MGHTLHKMEMARVRFLISAYLRIRLAKIERNIFHIVDEVAQAQEAGQTYRKLTKDELKFAQVGSSTFPRFYQTLSVSPLTITDQVRPQKLLPYQGASQKIYFDECPHYFFNHLYCENIPERITRKALTRCSKTWPWIIYQAKLLTSVPPRHASQRQERRLSHLQISTLLFS